MLKTFTSLLLLCLCITAFAQKPVVKADTLTAEQLNDTGMTVEKLLLLPAGYTVTYCDIVITINGELYKTAYVFATTTGAAVRRSYFSKSWTGMVNRPFHGYKITFDGIVAKKGDREVKLMPKTFVVP